MSFAKFAALLMTSSTMMLAGTASATQSETATPTPAPATEQAPANPMVGGAEMLPTQNIIENAVNSKDHTTLVAAVKAAGLVETLSGPGPFTVFAPTNDAFGLLDPASVKSLMDPANKATLERILKYHVVAGKVSAADLTKQIEAGGGKAMLTTVEGSAITASLENGIVVLTDANGNIAYVSQADVNQSNGVIHVVNGVLSPKLG